MEKNSDISAAELKELLDKNAKIHLIDVREDYEYVLKKLNISHFQFEKIMLQDRKEHMEFGMETGFYERYKYLKFLKPLQKLIKKMIYINGS